MKTTFKLICFALVAMGIMGCAKSELNEAKSSEITTMDAESAKREFAKILSKAVSNEESLRIFIKNAAEKRFDLDYDVFYPFVKKSRLNIKYRIRINLTNWGTLCWITLTLFS